jgi:hypothetical protein
MRVRKWLGCTSLFLLLAGLPAMALAGPSARGGAHGNFRVGGVARIYRPFPHYYFWGPADSFWGWGWGWSPWYYGPSAVNVYRINYGIVEFDVKPKNSSVYVDNKYLGTVSQLSGRHHEADLPGGYHAIKIVAPDGRTVERTVYLAVGQKLKFKQHFE